MGWNKQKEASLSLKEKCLKISAIFIMAALFVVFFWLFIQGFDHYGDAGFLYSFAKKPERILLAFLSFFFFVALYWTYGLIIKRLNEKNIAVINGIMWVLFLSVQAVFLFYIRSYYKWDSGFVIGGAASLAETGTVAEEAYYYLSVYPNQNTFVVLTAFLIKFSNILGISVVNRPFVFNIVNTVLMDISLVLLLRLLKKVYKRRIFHGQEDISDKDLDEKKGLLKREMSRIQCIFLCNPFLYLGVSYYYTITLSWIFMVGFLYLAFGENFQSSEKSEKVSYIKWIGAGILLGIGYMLRATAIIFVIAGLMVVFFRLIISSDNERKKLLLKAGVIGVFAWLTSSVVSVAQAAYVGIDTTHTAFPASHWIMMSLTQPGGHNAEDEAFTASFQTKEEKEIAVEERLKEKLQAMGVKGYIQLVKTKLCRTFGDGMNGYTTFLADGYGTGDFYDSLFGNHRDGTVLWHQGYYLFIMFGLLLALFKGIDYSERKAAYEGKGNVEYGFILYLSLVMLGAVLFYILWEASEQYSVPFMPVMIMLAFLGYMPGETIKEEKKHPDVRINRTVYILCLGAAVLVAAFCIGRRDKFLTEAIAQSQTAAVQILANAPTVVEDGETLVQNIKTKTSFNHLVLQWRNPLGEANDALYEIYLVNTSENIVCLREEIVAAEGGNQGAGIYNLETIQLPGKYQIRIRKLSGSPQCDLEFVLYDMYGYTPYPGGKLVREYDDGSKEELHSSLLFLLNEEKNTPYTTPNKYIFFTSSIFLIFLFMGICCKLEEIGCKKRCPDR